MKNLFLKSIFILGSFLLIVGCANNQSSTSEINSTSEKPQKPAYDNSYYYDAEGNFLADKAKDVYIEFMKYHNYPIYPTIKEDMWATDYGTGEFVKLGLSAVIYVNNEEDQYMLMDLLLLPNQMLPEHWHEATEKNPAKMEGWLIRAGQSHVIGEGEDNLSADFVIPQCHYNGSATVKHEIVCNPGDFAKLEVVGKRHWQYAGDEGAIITEVGNVHSQAGCFHTDPAINEHYLTN